jgi:virulence-associated protein VagC
MMKTTTVFKSGTSLAVRLPKGFTLPMGRVQIEKDGNSIKLVALKNGWPENFNELFAPDPDLDDWETPSRAVEISKDLSW